MAAVGGETFSIVRSGTYMPLSRVLGALSLGCVDLVRILGCQVHPLSDERCAQLKPSGVLGR